MGVGQRDGLVMTHAHVLHVRFGSLVQGNMHVDEGSGLARCLKFGAFDVLLLHFCEELFLRRVHQCISVKSFKRL